MQNLKDDGVKEEEKNPAALGLDEMNSVIKSFQDSSFNAEKLYKKDEKGFVKKTLYDLAVEAEKKTSELKDNETENNIKDNINKKNRQKS